MPHVLRFLKLSAYAFIFGVLLTLAEPQPTVQAGAEALCSGSALVVQRFANGAVWSFCWELRAAEGLRVSHAFFRTPSGVERRILWMANVGELYVPYDRGTPRLYDVSTGLGIYSVELVEADCPNKTLPEERRILSAIRPGERSPRPLVCREFLDRGVATMYTVHDPEGRRRGQEIAVWASHQSGEYNYIIRWTFYDDGSFKPQVGITGRQQILGEPHTHNMYWRIDLDLAGRENDVVETLAREATDPAPAEPGRLARPRWNTMLVEGGQDDNLRAFRSWRVRDSKVSNALGHSISYELVAAPMGSLRGNPQTEPFAQADFWATHYNPCELYAILNKETNLEPRCGGSVADFITPAEWIVDQDVVLWYAYHFYHLPSDEELRFIQTHWAEVTLRPRDFFDP